MSIVSNNIKYLRRMNGLTQEQFARKIGIKRSLLGAYEEGRANPNLDNLMNIAKVFGTSVDNLLQNDIRKLRESKGIPLPQPAQQLSIKEEAEPPRQLSGLIDKYYRQNYSAPPVPAPAPAPVIPPPETVRSVPQSLAFRSVSDNQTVNRAPEFYRPAEPELFKPAPGQVSSERAAADILWVSQSAAPEYLNSYAYPDYLKQLPALQLPMLGPGKYRAFETGADFPQPGSIVVGQFVNNWYDIRDGQNYVLIIYKQGILYRRVYNQVKIKGTLLVSSDNPRFPSYEVSIKEVLEVWEVKAYISLQMPQPAALPSLDRLKELAQAIQQEIDGLQ
jgi:transcriptional regulator with XRE-family HTH domain